MSLTANQKFAAAKVVVKKNAPYFVAALNRLIPVAIKGLGTFGVTDNGVMMWDPAFVAEPCASPEPCLDQHGNPREHTVAEIAGVLVHELGHVLRDHAGRRDIIGVPKHLLKTWNFAGDAEINDDVLEGGWKLPCSPVTPAGIGCADGLTAEVYYRHLAKQQKQQAQALADALGLGGPDGEGKGQGDEGDGKGKGQGDGDGEGQGSGWGACGSCAGAKLPQEGDLEGVPGRTPAEMERMKKETAEAIRAHVKQKGRGSVPGGWQRWAEAILPPSEIPWQTKLARAARQAVQFKAGAVDYKYDRPSRRQGVMGFGMGNVILPRMRAPVPRVAFVVDTSGSMGDDEMTDALGEAKAVVKAAGADIEFMACDAQVHALQKVRSVEDMKQLIKGGGGTDFRPAFEMLAKLRPTPDIVIYATDGYGPAPEQEPRNMKVIWLLMGRYGHTVPAPWGEVIEIKKEAA